jgi:hypothetical protein
MNDRQAVTISNVHVTRFVADDYVNYSIHDMGCTFHAKVNHAFPDLFSAPNEFYVEYLYPQDVMVLHHKSNAYIKQKFELVCRPKTTRPRSTLEKYQVN